MRDPLAWKLSGAARSEPQASGVDLAAKGRKMG
jgi:hypothetical protein